MNKVFSFLKEHSKRFLRAQEGPLEHISYLTFIKSTLKDTQKGSLEQITYLLPLKNPQNSFSEQITVSASLRITQNGSLSQLWVLKRIILGTLSDRETGSCLGKKMVPQASLNS